MTEEAAFTWEGMWPHQARFILRLSVEPSKTRLRLGYEHRTSGQVSFLRHCFDLHLIRKRRRGGRKRDGGEPAPLWAKEPRVSLLRFV